VIYEGKAKTLAYFDNPNLLLMKFKDQMTALNGKKTVEVPGKGQVSKKISHYLFQKLELNGINTHFVSEFSEDSLVVKNLKMIPLEVVLRRRAAGSFYKKMNYHFGYLFNEPLIEFYLKNDHLNDPLVTEDFLIKEKIISQDLLRQIKNQSLVILQNLDLIFKKSKLELVDIKLEFGITEDVDGEVRLFLADELSPDNFRVWDQFVLSNHIESQTSSKSKLHEALSSLSLDKDLFRNDLYNKDPVFMYQIYDSVYKKIIESSQN